MTEERLIVIIAEITVTTLGSIFFFKYRNENLKYFLLYLFIMLLFDTKDFYFDLSSPKLYYGISNAFMIFTNCFFMWLFRSYTLLAKRRKIVSIFILIYLSFILASSIIDGLEKGYDLAHLSGAIFVVLSIMYYAIDLFGRKELLRLDKTLILWVGIGYLVYFISFPVIQTARLYFVTSKELFLKLQTIHVAIIVLMYAIISFGFIYSDKTTTNEAMR